MTTRVRTDLGPGTPPALNFGAVPRSGGVEFVLFSRHATAVSVLLYDDPANEPTDEIVLDRDRNRRGDLWYVFVPNIGPGQIYAYKIDGPHCPEEGHRFDPAVVILDPGAKALTSNGLEETRTTSAIRASNGERPKCVVASDRFDWEDTRPPRYSLADSIIYECHVRGMTAHSSSGVKPAGTFLGVIEKIPYLKELGVTAVELLPIQEFDHLEHTRRNPITGELLGNYWGYSTVSFFAPNGRYAFGREHGAQIEEFKTMVRELHRNRIEVILDVVFNHTAEGNHLGPTINFKGADNSIYYFLGDDKRYYRDFSGCGNSINSNHPVVRQMIRNCLRYWVVHMGVDGFRFDLASVMSRDRNGRIVTEPPILESISEDPILRDTKIIAEAWDAAGAYQVGSFPGGRWAEWNGRFRDDIRQFWRGDGFKTGALATRLTGSSDLYQMSGRRPYHSINFITSHDGFTLNDLVSYNEKHNIANGEENRDGDNHNYSYNHGVEGPTDNPRIERIRIREIKNYLATLMLSQGVPMLVAGDEFRRTQQGNNNAYCQDNDISWINWSFLETHQEIFRFCKSLIWFRRKHPIFRRTDFFDGRRASGAAIADINWYSPAAKPKDWSHDDQTLMCLIDGTPPLGSSDPIDEDMLLMFNAGRRTVKFQLPAGDDTQQPWHLFLDTGNASPQDVYPESDGPFVRSGSHYPLIELSMACFYRRPNPRRRRPAPGRNNGHPPRK